MKCLVFIYHINRSIATKGLNQAVKPGLNQHIKNILLGFHVFFHFIDSSFNQYNNTSQGRQTRQNSGGVAHLTKGGLQNFFNFYAIKISTF